MDFMSVLQMLFFVSVIMCNIKTLITKKKDEE